MDLVLIWLAVVLVVFLVLREFWCWYWKISHAVDLLKDIGGKLDTMIKLNRDLTRLLKSATGEE
jgi:hypothetical protein